MVTHPIANFVLCLQHAGKKPTVLSLTVAKPDGDKIAGALDAAAAHNPTTIPRFLAQALMTVDAAAYNAPTDDPPIQDAVAPAGEPLVQNYRDDLIGIAEGRMKVVLWEGEPHVVDVNAPDHAPPAPVIEDDPAGNGNGSGSGGSLGANSGPLDSGSGSAGSAAGDPGSTTTQAPDGSAAGEKHTGTTNPA